MAGVKGQSGGARPGAGRKPKSAFERAVTGNPSHSAKVLAGPGAGQVPIVAPLEPVEMPADLPEAEAAIWRALAPHATAARTLTKGTALSFRLLCRNVVLEQQMAGSVRDRGGSSHRGMIQRVDAELLRFNLSPCGKAIYEPQSETPAANPLQKFLTRTRG
jgi:hypothetical protein